MKITTKRIKTKRIKNKKKRRKLIKRKHLRCFQPKNKEFMTIHSTRRKQLKFLFPSTPKKAQEMWLRLPEQPEEINRRNN